MPKLSAKWVPKCPNADQKHQQRQSPEQLLEFFQRDPNDFHGRNLVISLWPRDKATINRVVAEQLTTPISPRFFGIKTPPSSLIIFQGQTINAEYYLSLLVQLKDILKEKCCGKVTKGVLFLNNAPAHRALATQKKLAYLGFQCLDHPPYSLHLALSDYHLFPGLKKQLKGRHFSSDMEVIAAAETWLDGQHSEFFSSGLKKLEQWAKKCTELCGEYIE